MIELFDLEDVNAKASRLDPAKLGWLNQQYLKTDDPAEVAQAPGMAPAQRRVTTSPAARRRPTSSIALRDRVQTLKEMAERAAVWYRPLTHYDDAAVAKHLTAGRARAAGRCARAPGDAAGVDGRSGRRRAARRPPRRWASAWARSRSRCAWRSPARRSAPTSRTPCTWPGASEALRASTRRLQNCRAGRHESTADHGPATHACTDPKHHVHDGDGFVHDGRARVRGARPAADADPRAACSA